MSKIGRYEIEAEIGRGAMGVVHLAHDPRLQRRLAVKTYTLPQGLSSEQKAEFRARFLVEAQAAARLSHPGIVTVYDADEDADRDVPYIAMEYVPGKSLKEIVEETEEPFEIERVVAIVEVLAEALHVAHEAGIVHRDIKPANLLVRTSDGAIKIADFGVAKLSSSTLTQPGISIGSPAYMSPEQVRGRSIDGRSDLFSLAVILYELLCGDRPFNGDDPTALIYSVVYETPVPITKRMKGLPAGLDRFFDSALGKDPDDRFQDGKAFRQAFEAACRKAPAVDVEATVHETVRRVELSPAADLGPDPGIIGDPPPRHFPDLEDQETGPSRRRIVLASVAVLFVIWVGWSFFGGKGVSHLMLDAKSGVESGTLVVLVDGVEVYQRELSAPRMKRGLVKKVLY
ncbi:MAG: serine/threonine-protein kinase, partial [Gemmatimonadales bacterium]